MNVEWRKQMSELILIDNKYVTLKCDPEKKIVYHQFHMFTRGEAVREVLVKGIEAFEKYQCTKWLSDDRELNILHPDNHEWASTQWAPRIMAAGWKYWAVLMPNRFIGKLTHGRLVKFYKDKNVVVKEFEDPNAAMEWLETQP
jgi:hypothetical protein